MQKLRLSFALLFAFVLNLSINAQVNHSQNDQYKKDSIFFKNIYEEALLRGHSYARLGELCKDVGARLSGSDAAERGVLWAIKMLNAYGFDSVYTQPVMVPRWERGNQEKVQFQSALISNAISKKQLNQLQQKIANFSFSNSPNALYECENLIHLKENTKNWYPLSACALGGSIGSKVEAKVICIQSKNQLDSLGKIGALKNKIVLMNRPMDETLLNTFNAYGGCVNQRVNGAVWCAPYGAVAVLVRSVTNKCDNHPHTGVSHYEDSIRKIPIAAVSTADANLIQYLSVYDSTFKINIQLNCQIKEDRLSANVIAESKGSLYPNKIIAFGGHFDSWDQGEGAHDDGAGCMHAFEALRILKTLGYQPRHTIRSVFWMNEENGLKGGLAYAALTQTKGEVHLAALESDRGGFTPRGFGIDTSILSKVKCYQKLLSDYGVGTLENGGGGADIGPLKKTNPNIALISFIPDSQRYFDVHHAETDVFESVNKRELELGAAAIATMIYILDQQLD
jgi:hypothetical protein